MASTRTEKSIRNAKYGLIGQIFLVIFSFILRKIFLNTFNDDYLGLGSVFLTILNAVNVCELGLSSAIIFCLYKPLVNDDRAKVAAYMKYMKKAYYIVGGVVLVLGLSLTPILHFFVRVMPDIENIRLIYVMFVINSAMTYPLSYRAVLLTADQRQYAVSRYRYFFKCLFHVVQIIVLRFTHNYLIYLSCTLVFNVIENGAISLKVHHDYPYISEKNVRELTKAERSDVKRRVKASALHKLGSYLVFGTEAVFLARLCGVNSATLYQNYYTIQFNLKNFMNIFFSSFSASIGNMYADSKDENKKYNVYNILNFICAWIAGFTSVSLALIYNPFIELWLGPQYLFDKEAVALISLSFYFFCTRIAMNTTKDAFGLFVRDKYKYIAQFAVYVVLAIIMGRTFREAGIFAAMLIADLVTCFWIEPRVLFKYGFKKPVSVYFKKYALHALTAAVGFFITYALVRIFCTSNPGMIFFVLRVVFCVTVPNLVYLLIWERSVEFRECIIIAKRVLRKLLVKLHIVKN